MPAGDGVGGRELVIQCFGDDAGQPGGDVDVAFFTQPRQPLPQLGIDAALDVFVTLHYMTWYGFPLGNAISPGSFPAFPQGSFPHVATPAHGMGHLLSVFQSVTVIERHAVLRLLDAPMPR